MKRRGTAIITYTCRRYIYFPVDIFRDGKKNSNGFFTRVYKSLLEHNNILEIGHHCNLHLLIQTKENYVIITRANTGLVDKTMIENAFRDRTRLILRSVFVAIERLGERSMNDLQVQNTTNVFLLKNICNNVSFKRLYCH